MQIQLTELFLVASTVFTVALAEGRGEPLKTALSIAGLIVALTWALCSFRTRPSTEDGVIGGALCLLPLLACLGWVVSIVIHARNWKSGKSSG